MAKTAYIAVAAIVILITAAAAYLVTQPEAPSGEEEEPALAEFEITSLVLSPAEAKIGQTITVTVEVKNSGEETGTHNIVLMIDEEEFESRNITLTGGETKTLDFTLVRNVGGDCKICVGNMTKALRVYSLAPANFEVSNLVIEPSEIKLGQSCRISVNVRNTGELQGTHTVALKINGKIQATEEVVIDGGEIETVVFTVTKDIIGTYAVSVDGLTDLFSVRPDAPNITMSVSVPSTPYLGNNTIIVTIYNGGGGADTTLSVSRSPEESYQQTAYIEKDYSREFTFTIECPDLGDWEYTITASANNEGGSDVRTFSTTLSVLRIAPIDITSFIASGDASFYSYYPDSPSAGFAHERDFWTLQPEKQFVLTSQTNLIYGGLVYWTNTNNCVNSWCLQSSQVTKTTADLAIYLKNRHPNDKVLQVKETYYFVREYIDYQITHYDYPVTTLSKQRGMCADQASLLATLLHYQGFDVTMVLTGASDDSGFHAWVVVHLPEYAPWDVDQNIVTSKLGEGWIGLDPTWDLRFGELIGEREHHSNIISIFKVPIFGCIYDLTYNWDKWNLQLGYYLELNAYLGAFLHEEGNNVKFNFYLYQDGILRDSKTVTVNNDSFHSINIIFDYESAWTGGFLHYLMIDVQP